MFVVDITYVLIHTIPINNKKFVTVCVMYLTCVFFSHIYFETFFFYQYKHAIFNILYSFRIYII